MLLLLPIVEFLLVPLAATVRDAAIQQISDRVVEKAQGRVSSWLASFGGEEPEPDRAELRQQLATDPELATQLHQAIAQLPGMPAIPALDDDLPGDGADRLLDGVRGGALPVRAHGDLARSPGRD